MPNRRSDAAPGRGSPKGMTAPAGHLSADLPWELPHSFLGLDEAASELETARAVILPIPYETTTSYGGGTRYGPQAILEASRYVELFDQELEGDSSIVGIHTLPALELTREGPGPASEELEGAFGTLLRELEDRFVVSLGGEHSISAPLIRALAAHVGRRVSVLQFDAHADLRADYEGTPHSHASAMRRVLDVADVVGVGIRGLCREEVDVAETTPGVVHVYADDMWEDDGWMERAMDSLGDPVYITFDVDYFDPSLMPSTGTPEPGGGDWYRTLKFLRRVFVERTVLACDLVELAPIPGLAAPDFTVAKLAYKLIGYRFHS